MGMSHQNEWYKWYECMKLSKQNFINKMEGDYVPFGYSRSICHHGTLETKVEDHEFEANLSYTVKYYINSIKQANKQLQVDIFS